MRLTLYFTRSPAAAALRRARVRTVAEIGNGVFLQKLRPIFRRPYLPSTETAKGSKELRQSGCGVTPFGLTDTTASGA